LNLGWRWLKGGVGEVFCRKEGRPSKVKKRKVDELRSSEIG
jgi:hypothetical protein